MRIDVSDHAVVRYLEREKGVDIKALKAEMLTPTVRTAIKAGAVGVVVGSTSLKVCRTGSTAVIATATDRKKRFYKLKAGK